MDEARKDRPNKHGMFRRIAARTLTSYVRMCATVVIAVVVRICLDCIGIILTGQEPAAVSFWFAHCACEDEGSCLVTGICIFVASLMGGSAFAWSVKDWITDPVRNSRARYHSFEIVVEAATWVPISVVVGKTNAVVEWFMDVTENDLIQALVASAIAAAITLICTILTHVAMKHCESVGGNAQRTKAGLEGYFQFTLMATLYCLGWAVGWSNWKLVLSMMDALEPGASVHNTVLAGAVISIFLVVAVCFYLRFGPEPIIPDPELQELCYGHGYSGSIRRSLISYAVNSCTVFVVLSCSDPTYGFVYVVTEKIYSVRGSSPMTAAFHENVLVLLALSLVACVATALAVLCSAAITKTTEVDQSSSMRMSRSVSHARQEMLTRRLSCFSESSAPDSRDELEMVESTSTAHPISEEGDVGFTSASEGDGDEAAGCPGRGMEKKRMIAPKNGADRDRSMSDPMCEYCPMDVESVGVVSSSSSTPTHTHHISRTMCVSVLAYDVLGLVVCTQWGTFASRSYGILFGKIAAVHSVLYLFSSLLYAGTSIYLITRFVSRCFPSQDELKWRRGRRGGDQSWWLMAEAKEPFLEDEDDGEDAVFFDRAPPAWPSGVSWPPMQAMPPLPFQPPVQGYTSVPIVTGPESSPQGAI